MTKDTSVKDGERYVYYFFTPPIHGREYGVIRSVVDIKIVDGQEKIFIVGFDEIISKGETKIISYDSQIKPTVKDLDTDIAYGYEVIELSTISLNANVQIILRQIQTKYGSVIRSLTLQSVEVLELKSGKLNYKFIYVNSENGSIQRIMVYYDPFTQRVIVLNRVTPVGHAQFEELSSE